VLSLPFNVVAVMGLEVLSVVPPRHQRAAAGPFLMCLRADYLQVGGHEVVRAAIVEDMALARRFDAAGFAVHSLASVPEVGFRMYPGGFRDIVRGWSKNFATGAAFTPRWRALLIAIWITASLVAAASLVRGALHPIPIVAVYGLFAAQWAVLGRRVGRFGLAALLWPLLAAFFVVVFVWSLVSTYVLRRVRWRGRIIETTPDRR
jgi:4,4'-diaponeurosporenoate glycosyltransferase